MVPVLHDGSQMDRGINRLSIFVLNESNISRSKLVEFYQFNQKWIDNLILYSERDQWLASKWSLRMGNYWGTVFTAKIPINGLQALTATD